MRADPYPQRWMIIQNNIAKREHRSIGFVFAERRDNFDFLLQNHTESFDCVQCTGSWLLGFCD